MPLDEREMDKKAIKIALVAGGIIALLILGFIIAGLMFPAPVKQAPVVTSPAPSGSSDNIILDLISPVVVLKGSKQYEKMYPTPTPTSSIEVTVLTPEPTPTPKPTITVVPTSKVRNVNPFDAGERWERQWYRWKWYNVSGLQSADRGIVVYRHLYLDSYTYWNDAWGQYINVFPKKGMRFLAVYVHQEDFDADNSGIWGYPNSSFKLQYDGVLHDSWKGHDPVYRIVELEDHYSDYYDIAPALPYGSKRVYGGMRDYETGGYHVEWWVSLWSGKGNAWDGYILYEVPVTVTDDDIRIVGLFAGKGVNWRFDADTQISEFPASRYEEVVTPAERIVI